jgi:hypothetical protein
VDYLLLFQQARLVSLQARLVEKVFDAGQEKKLKTSGFRI